MTILLIEFQCMEILNLEQGTMMGLYMSSGSIAQTIRAMEYAESSEALLQETWKSVTSGHISYIPP